MGDWRDYQEQAATLFRELGFVAQTEATVQGARAAHKVDVVAEYDHAGVRMLWAVECKYWGTRVPKEKVLAFRGVLDDIGADRGVLLTKIGFQSGAHDAARYSNMTLTSLEGLRALASETLTERRLLAVPERLARAHARYWCIPKGYREESGLKPELGDTSYSAAISLMRVPEILVGALSGIFPIETSAMPLPIHTKESAAGWMEEILAVLENRLDVAEAAMPPGVAALHKTKLGELAAAEVPDEPSEDEIARARHSLFEPYYPPAGASDRSSAIENKFR